VTLTPRPRPKVSTEHIHAPVISIKEQARVIAAKLAELGGRASFRQLTATAAGGYEIVATFLALLELYRDDAVSFDQAAPLGDLFVTWTGHEDTDSVKELTESDDQDQ
jgi:segregation and condensation protein A